MGSLRFSDYSSSPTIFFPPQSHHPFNPVSHQQHFHPFQSNRPRPHRSSWKPVSSATTIYTNPSRKRARDDDDDNLSADVSPIATPQLEEKPVIYGEGMTIIDASTGRTNSAESQTGTWYEEQLEIERQAAARAAESLAIASAPTANRPAKIHRLDSLPTPSLGQPDTQLSTGVFRSRETSDSDCDVATRVLGVGWTSISSNNDLDVAARGWAKYIEKHYPSLSNVQILLKSAGYNAFLVKAIATEDTMGVEGLYLFSDDLSEGQLVAHDEDVCIGKLKVSPIVFDGQEVLRAIKSPMIVAEKRVAIDASESSHLQGLTDSALAVNNSAASENLPPGMEIDS